MTTAAPVKPPGSPDKQPHRRPALYAAVGGALAVLLAVVLFAGIGTGGHGSGSGSTRSIAAQVPGTNLVPGINSPTSLLLSLTVFHSSPPKQAPDFQLTDQHGNPVSMSSFRGKVVVFSANDDKCQDLCTLLANDIVLANQDLGPAAKDVVWLSVNANPFYPQVSAVRTWTDEHGLGNQPNWHFGTASPAVLQQVWKEYGVEVQLDSKTRTISHSTEMFFVDPNGNERAVTEFGTSAASTSLFAHGLAQVANDLLPRSQRVHVKGPLTPSPNASNATVGALAPAFTLPYLDGGSGRLTLSSLKGHYVVLNFWSSTCTVCRVELPSIEASYRATGSQVRFVGVDVSDSPVAARAMAASAHLTYPLVADSKGAASGGERISGLPFTVILGPAGHVLVRHPGNITTEQLTYILQSVDPTLSLAG